MSLYPSLEDMKVDKMIGAQQHVMAQQQQQMSASFATPAYTTNPYPELNNASQGTLSGGMSNSYPDLVNYMGLELSQDAIAANMPQYLKNNQVAVPQSVFNPLCLLKASFYKRSFFCLDNSSCCRFNCFKWLSGAIIWQFRWNVPS